MSAIITLEPSQFTLFKWSRDWYENFDTFNKSLHNFRPNLIWTTNFNRFLFYDCLFIKNPIIVNIKLEVL